MTDPAVRVTPYWELTFDADGDVDDGERRRLLAEAGTRGVRDLIVFAHGWNNDRSGATRLYDRFFAQMPALAPHARLGYVGVVWPSMRFCDEPIPDFPRTTAAADAPARPARHALDKGTRQALVDAFPGRAPVVDQIAAMLDRPPAGDDALDRFGALVRTLVDATPQRATCAPDTQADGDSAGEPAMFTGSTAETCEEFAAALAHVESGGTLSGFALPDPWTGARELLRQATYYEMKRRAGTVGEHGLGPALGRLATAAPEVRVHLVGHSFGGRLVSFALRGLPDGVRTVKSVTLLQGAFSHYAFADRLPHDARAAGALRGLQHRIDGPLVCCYSRFDAALGTLYPLASRVAGDVASVAVVDRLTAGFLDVGRLLGPKWGAMGHDGVQAVPGTRGFGLSEALRAGLPAAGCVNIDAGEVVRNGGPPCGAHSDIVHPQLAQVVLAAGRVR